MTRCIDRTTRLLTARRLTATPPAARGSGPVHNTNQHLHVVRVRRFGKGEGKCVSLLRLCLAARNAKTGALGGEQCAGIRPIGGLPKTCKFVPGGVERAGNGHSGRLGSMMMMSGLAGFSVRLQARPCHLVDRGNNSIKSCAR